MALKQVVFILVLLSIYRCRATNIFENDDIELEEQLKLLNKPPVETFMTEEGDTIDCVDIDKQPALGHPLLRNHKVQRKPNLPLSNFSKTSASTKYVQFGSRKPCPIGTAPIQRIKKEDLIKIRALPKIPSANMVEIENAPLSGQHVDPGLNGDGVTRLFSYWTGDGFRDGCFNTLCEGFVQVDRALTPNHPITPVSRYGGPIYEIRIEVSQELTGNWWLRVHDPLISMGYWPKELFTNLREGSLHTAWGGVGKEGAAGYCLTMSNGQMPDADTRKAAYFRNVRWVNAKTESLPPGGRIAEVVDTPGCYGVLDQKLKPDPWGSVFSFGGPGGYCRS